jgi:hypothetical protein
MSKKETKKKSIEKKTLSRFRLTQLTCNQRYEIKIKN